jgi:hypothetical protein
MDVGIGALICNVLIDFDWIVPTEILQAGTMPRRRACWGINRTKAPTAAFYLTLMPAIFTASLTCTRQ